MKSYKLVMPEHLNQFGHIFGGNLLKWADEYAWIAASLDYPDCKLVAVGMDEVSFKANVKEGSILEFDLEKVKEGMTFRDAYQKVGSDINKIKVTEKDIDRWLKMSVHQGGTGNLGLAKIEKEIKKLMK